jgi:apolipoprotein N-acyltransferase
MKNFRIKIKAYGYWADFTVQASEEGKSLENAIIDKLGKNDIKWDKSDFYDQIDDKIREVITEIKLEEAKIATRENAIANSAPQVSVAT